MSEEKRTCVVIASVLKPCDDVRMFEKIARTIASANHEVHSIGFGNTSSRKKDNVCMHGLGVFTRLSFKRWSAKWKVLKKTIALRPTHLIITTHELLFIALLVKLFTKARVIYDVQENYYLNIRYTNAFPAMLKGAIAALVRMKETLLSAVVDHFLLAEKVYTHQLPFLRRRFTIIENKIRKPVAEIRKRDSEMIRLIFTGILAETTGVFIAIGLAEKLYRIDDRIRLALIGFAPQKTTLEKIELAIRERHFISLVGGAGLVPHDKIVDAIRGADFGVISYPPNPATKGRIPTKLYEYIGHQLPMLLIDRPEWVQLCVPMNAAVVYRYPLDDLETVLHKMTTVRFYSTGHPASYWEDQEPALLSAIFNH